ncbi:MAG TPA: LLM class flavin-dependent oxidoreductase [Pseudolabrys sp.]|nr:LLM class flavin-dependent oxidoreductase [Pseudolabrys sp.]
MQFGLFCSPKADAPGFRPETGKGYRHSEFNGFAIPQDEAEERFEEALALMLRAWGSRERFTHHGRFWSCNDAIVEPPPAQTPHPPLWVAAGNAHSIGRAGERGFNLILDQYASPDVLAERIAVYKAARDKAGLAFDPGQVAVARLAYVADDAADRDAALKRQAEYTARTVNVSRRPDANRQGTAGSHVLAYADRAGATEEHALFGTPDELRAKVAALREAGVRYLLLSIFGGPDQLRRFAREVMPAFAGARAAAAE